MATAGSALLPRSADALRIDGIMPLAFGQNSLELSGVGGQRIAPEVLPLTTEDDSLVEDTAELAKGEQIAAEIAEALREEAERAKAERQAREREEADQDGGVPLPAGSVVKPAEGRLTSGFGARWGTTHNGIDIANDIGTPIRATTDGVVVESGPASGFGLWVRLQHSDGTISVYGHLNRSLVEQGQRVRAGEKIAEMGNRGYSTGPHLHFEIWQDGGRKINPLGWLRNHGVDL